MMKRRQQIRWGLILFSFFLFPVTYYYFSPSLIVYAAMQETVNGSFIVFACLFASSLLLGRAFCGWVCPGAGCQEALFAARNRRVRKGDFIKWLIWVPWILSIALLAVRAGGYAKVDFFYQTRHGMSVQDTFSLIKYLFVLLVLIVLPALAVGRRSFCHHLCWMAPFMIIGRKLRNLARWPSLQLASEANKCTHCHICTKDCPMSLPVETMVGRKQMENAECILCGSCVDVCEPGAIRYEFR